MSDHTPNRLPADFAGFDEEALPDELAADFAGFDNHAPDEPPAGFDHFDKDSASSFSTAEAPSPMSQSGTAVPPGSVSQLLEPLPKEERDQVMSFAQTLGATVTHVIPRGAPDPIFPRGAAHGWEAWCKERIKGIFARAREERGRKSFDEQAQEEAEEQRRERQRRKDWLHRQRRIAHGWARWMRWRSVNLEMAEAYRQQHEGADGSDLEWLIRLASMPGAPTRLGKSAKGKTEEQTYETEPESTA